MRGTPLMPSPLPSAPPPIAQEPHCPTAVRARPSRGVICLQWVRLAKSMECKGSPGPGKDSEQGRVRGPVPSPGTAEGCNQEEANGVSYLNPQPVPPRTMAATSTAPAMDPIMMLVPLGPAAEGGGEHRSGVGRGHWLVRGTVQAGHRTDSAVASPLRRLSQKQGVPRGAVRAWHDLSFSARHLPSECQGPP